MLVASAICAVGASAAFAGPRTLAMVQDATTTPENDVELEAWLDFGHPSGFNHDQRRPQPSNGMPWFGVRTGLLEGLEIASYLVFEKKSDVARAPGSNALVEDGSGFQMWSTMLKWRPVAEGRFAIDPFVQFEVIDWFERYHPIQFHLTLGGAKKIGRWSVQVNAGYWDSTNVEFREPPDSAAAPRWHWLDMSVGASFDAIVGGRAPALALGFEAWGLIPLQAFGLLTSEKGHIHNHFLHGGGMVVGPTAFVSKGRLWLTGHMGMAVIGNSDPNETQVGNLFSRLVLGIAL